MSRLRNLKFPSWSAPLALLAAALLAYALLISTLGLYWDDYAFIWIGYKLGPQALAQYFSTNRPFYGMVVQAVLNLLGAEPQGWQVYALFWRWVSAVSLWFLLRRIWKNRPGIALAVSLLYLVYPGAVQQYIAVVFSHFWMVLAALFFSFACTLLALEDWRCGKTGRAVLWTAAGLLCSVINLVPLDYFYTLELLRPALVWVYESLNFSSTRRARLKTTLLAWAPYLVLFLGVALWRMLFFSYQTQNYQPLLLEQLKANPLLTLWKEGLLVLRNLWTTSLGAWSLPFRLPDIAELGARTTLVWAALTLLTLVLAGFYLFKFSEPARVPETDAPLKKIHLNPEGWYLIWPGLLGMLLAGIPFWATGLDINLGFPNSRVTLPFIPGVSLLLAGLGVLIPIPRKIKLGLLALAVAAATGLQFQYANIFRRDTSLENTLFWQLAWRMPALETNTALLINELPIHYSTDNSLTAPLNWTLAPQNTAERMGYVFLYPSLRMGPDLPELKKGLPIHRDYLATSFNGSTSQAVALYYNPPACLRVLDPDLDSVNPTIPPLMRDAARLSQPSLVHSAEAGQEARPPRELFPREPTHGWCYYFQQADRARQAGEWEEVARLGEEAFALNDHPNDPMERLPFLEGYAHLGNWERALQLGEETAAVTPLMQPVLCRLWQRIEETVPASPEKETALQQARAGLECGFSP